MAITLENRYLSIKPNVLLTALLSNISSETTKHNEILSQKKTTSQWVLGEYAPAKKEKKML